MQKAYLSTLDYGECSCTHCPAVLANLATGAYCVHCSCLPFSGHTSVTLVQASNSHCTAALTDLQRSLCSVGCAVDWLLPIQLYNAAGFAVGLNIRSKPARRPQKRSTGRSTTVDITWAQTRAAEHAGLLYRQAV